MSADPVFQSRKSTGLANLIGVLALCLAGCGGADSGVMSTAGGSVASGSSVTVQQASVAAAPASAPMVQAQAAVLSVPATPAQRFAVAFDDMEVLGPFPSWANAKTDYQAVGDGVADDGPAIQRALDDLGRSGKPSVLYLPAGTYKIGATLKFVGSTSQGGFGWGGLGLIGESPSATRIVWSGPAGAPMLVQNGGAKYRYARITWDGKGSAGMGVAHWWNAKSGILQGGGAEHVDEVFMDMKIGIMGGRLGANYGELDSEGQIRRVTFIRNSFAGVDTGSWNADNWWVWDSHFVDCARGVSNNFTVTDLGTSNGAGGLFVYRSLFERSTVADFNIGNTGWFSMYQNVSIGSRRFFQGDPMGNNSAQVIIKGNRIIDTTDPAAVVNGNVGPLILIDNKVRSANGASGPVVVANNGAPGRDVVSLGNQYTVQNPIKQVDTRVDRLLSDGDTIVARASIDGAAPALPATPVRADRRVFEVPSGASATMIQAIVNIAASSGALNPVVHFPPGDYPVSQPIVMPASLRLQIVGDAMTTQMRWTGPAGGSIFKLQGPSLVTIRDLFAVGPAYLASISQADQPGGRIYLQGNDMGPIEASDLVATQLHMQANPNVGGFNFNNVKNVVAIATGGLGPVKSTNNSSTLIADTWYEGSATDLFRVDSGSLTYIGGHMGPATHPGTADLTHPPVLLDGFKGQATFIGAQFNVNSIINWTAIQIGTETADTNALFLGVLGFRPGYFKRASSGGNVGLLMSKTWNVSANTVATQVDQGSRSSDFINKMLVQLRALTWDTAPYQAPAEATDVRIYRVKADQTNGLLVKGAP